ncbi:MAG TPA: RHS repeat-associated core domain-containing protein, partial [Puia sp.]|nr:RHS repeat-associated core domain-containing protein [Puia sp.]
GGSKPIDQLTYNYVNGPGNSNRLAYVNDNANVTNSTLGDFHYPGSGKTSSSVDFTYDADANTISDANRTISAISYYSYPNLPKQITTPKGTITFTYDASGEKLKTQVIENGITINGTATNLTTTTYYVDGAEYKTVAYSAAALASLNTTDVLQFFGTEDGRLRFKPALGTAPAQFVHDYLIRDQLGHVRVGLTDEVQQDIYPAATGEITSVTSGGTTSTAQNYESQYYSFNASDFVASSSLPWFSAISGSSYPNENDGGIPANNDPFSQTTATSTKVFQVCGNTANNPSGDNFGLGITLKVMAGDVVNIYGLSFWHNSGNLPTGSYPVSAVLGSLLGAFGGSSAVSSTLAHSALGSGGFNNAVTTPTATSLNPMLSPASAQSGTQAPYAGINYIIFDDQFKPQGTVVGFDPVSTSTDNIKQHSLAVTIPKNGYIFVYVSNQSNLNVYFDNLQVTQTRGPLLEETHYYPAGVAMAGISDRAWNKQPNYHHYQGKEMQDEEWHDGSGLEEYDFKARYYDPQLGRWNTQDPASQYASPYAGMGNNWPNGIDLDGKNFWTTLGAIGIIVGAVALTVATDGLGLMAAGGGWVAGGIVAGAGYLGASWAGGSWAPWQWNSNAWQGALAGVIAGASAVVGGAEFFEPAISSSEDAVAGAWGAGEASIGEGAANGVFIKLAETETTALLEKGTNMSWQQAVGATFGGAISGAFAGWNPTGPLTEEDGTQFTGFGLRLPGNSLLNIGEKALYNVASTTGGGILTSALQGSNPFAKVNVPLGWDQPLTLTFGKKQALLQLVNQTPAAGYDVSQLGTAIFTTASTFITNNVIKPYSSLVANEILQLIFDPRPKKH